MSEKRYVLGIDGGSSKTLALLADEDGVVIGRGQGGTSNFYLAGDGGWQQALVTAVSQAFLSAGMTPFKVDQLCLGLSGVDRPEERQLVADWLHHQQFAEHNYVDNDVFLLLWSGHDHPMQGMRGWGVGLIAGTGSIAIGRTEDGRTARAGGWGYLFGDEGSGFAIGCAALRAVCMADDGRKPDTILKEMILDRWRLTSTTDLIPLLYSNNAERNRKIASLAVVVQEAASLQDEVAIKIEAHAANNLALALGAVCRKLDFKAEVPLALGGSVLIKNELLAGHVLLQLNQQGWKFSPIAYAVVPADGAVAMALHSMYARDAE